MDNSLFDNYIDPLVSDLYPICKKDDVLGLTNLVLKFDKNKMRGNIILHERNFGNGNSYILDGRPCSTSLCSSGKFCESSGWPELFDPNINQCDNYFLPQSGRGEPRKYLQNIDIESRVRNIDYKINKCEFNYPKKGTQCKQGDDKCQLNCYKHLLKRDHRVSGLQNNNSKYETSRKSVEANRQKIIESKKNFCKPIKNAGSMEFLVDQPTKRINTVQW